MLLAVATFVALSPAAAADLGRAEILSLIQAREALLSEYRAEFVQHDLAEYSAMPDVAVLRLNVQPNRYRWDIDFELGPNDGGADIHATVANNGSEVLHWRRTLNNADLFAAPATDILQHLTPKQNSWSGLYLWPPIPGVPARFDPKVVLADLASEIAVSGAGGESIIVSGMRPIGAEPEPRPIQFHVAVNRGYAIERLRFQDTGWEIRALEWHEVLPNSLWVPSVVVSGDEAYWSAIDAGGPAAESARANREIRLALDHTGAPAFSLVADPVPDDLISILPHGTVVQNAMTKGSLIAGLVEPTTSVVVSKEAAVGPEYEPEAPERAANRSGLALLGGLGLAGVGVMLCRRRT